MPAFTRPAQGAGSQLGIQAALLDQVAGHLGVDDVLLVGVVLGVGQHDLAADVEVGEGELHVYDADDLSLIEEVAIPDWPDYGGLAWVTEGSRLVVATGSTLVEFSTPDYVKLTQTALPSNPARVAYDAVRGYYVVTFMNTDMVRVYQVPE